MRKSKKTQKKIGIITFHRAINYGAILQVYALQKKIEQLGGKCEVLDYRNDILEARHKEKSFSDIKNLKDILRYILIYRNYNKKHKKFRNFINENISLSRVYNFEELEELSDKYDLFITGSDQVWNYSITNFDTAYFLDFVNDSVKKNSYAASFGISNIPKELKNKYYELLKDYNHMSLRELQGANIIKQLYDKEVDVVLDPTLLLNKNEWVNIANNNLIKDKYILIYAFGGSKYLMNLAKKLSDITGLKIVTISNNYKYSLNIKHIKTAGPEEFLGLFKNAEYVFTNSFHGTAFSINFNKQFFTEFLPEEHGVNSRLEDILDLFNLRNRQVKNDNINILNSTIDYVTVNKKLAAEREKSIAFLSRIIND